MEKKLNFWYGSIFGTYWMIYGVTSSFASVFLLAKGYSNSQIGMTLAAANILAVILQPLVADIADRSKKAGPIGIPAIMSVMMMIFTFGLFVLRAGSLAICVVMVLLIGWHTVLQPMFNALTFRLEESGIPVNFGVARSVGSLAYSLIVAVMGTLVEKLGVMTLPAATEITIAMLLISLYFTKRTFDKAVEQRRGAGRTPANDATPAAAAETDELAAATKTDEPADAAETDRPREPEQAGRELDTETDRPREPEQAGAAEARNTETEDPADDEPIGLVRFIKRNRLFFVLNLGVVGLFFSNSVLNNYMLQIVTDVGGNSEDMGRILGLMAFLEIPTMVMFSRLRNRFSCQLLLKVSSVGFALKILLHWLAKSVGMLFAAQFFQLIGFALFFPGMVYFIGEYMSRGEAIKGQALFTTMITVATIFAALLGGWILDASGAKTLTLIATLATLAGALVIFAVVDRIGKTGDRPRGKTGDRPRGKTGGRIAK